MEILDYISIGWSNGWWFTVVFGLANLVFLVAYPRQFSKRLFKIPTFKSMFERMISIVSVIVFMRGMMIYTIFVPMVVGTVWFYIGVIIFMAGLVVYISAMKAYADTAHELPVVTGAYRISRHPMQVFSLIMWLGVGIATLNWIILLICCLQPFLTVWFLKSQERYCLEKYGERYREYLQKTPRYILS